MKGLLKCFNDLTVISNVQDLQLYKATTNRHPNRLQSKCPSTTFQI